MRDARPWLGFFVGLILGIALAVVLQQAGVWPLDQLMVFGLAGLFALLGSWLGGLGRESFGAFATYAPLVLAIAMIAYGAVGLGDTGEHGNINGGCLVQAQSDVDSTDVFDTSRGDPFDIDPDGGLSWVATSPGVIMDHHWAIYVEFAGFDIKIRSGSHPNKGGSEISSGQVEDLQAEIQKVTVATGQELRGTFIVSGDISVATGVVCDGFGFVRLTSDSPLESLVAKIAAALAALMLLILLTILLRRGGGGTEEAATAVGDQMATDVDEGNGAADQASGMGTAAGMAGGAAATGPGESPDNGDEDSGSANGGDDPT